MRMYSSIDRRRMLSEIEKPPSTAATPRTTPSDCRAERVKFSRISTHALRSRSRKAPLKLMEDGVTPLPAA
jgi:hypothetical protein